MARRRKWLVIPVDSELLCPQLASVRCMAFFMRVPVSHFCWKEERLQVATAALVRAGDGGGSCWGRGLGKPRINSQLVAQQVAQQYATPPPPKKEKKEKVEKQDKEKPEKDKEISPSVTKKNTNKKTKPKSDVLKDPPSEANSIQSANATTKTSESNHTSRPRLKNVDRSTAQQLAVTVGNVTVIITDFKEKTRSSSTSSSTVTSSAGSEQQHQSSSGSESTDKGSSRSSTPKGDLSAVNDESF
ncbi:RING1 and YY1-binding protein isoform X1 [Eptesicus fuscus]|uniref:RING1 and YY1-binding protein isoform X1 n=1 Tax=Eptesicus fuscus TaxID=29078 RepID=UPI0024048F5C|nr:RING1 and YY1-binding protein isoform X1 [Eptesicus fuscus]